MKAKEVQSIRVLSSAKYIDFCFCFEFSLGYMTDIDLICIFAHFRGKMCNSVSKMCVNIGKWFKNADFEGVIP